MMESWDDDNFEPPAIAPVVNPVVNKWAGEDEEEEVKDNWEDDDDEKKEEEVKVVEPVKKSKKKILSEKIAEKERMKNDDKRIKEYEDEDELSPEEKLRRQQESDLKLALETTFSTGDSLGDLPTNKEDLQEFGDNLSKKLLLMSKNAEFVNFAENFVRNLCAGLPSQDIRKIKNSLDNLYLEKQKIEKGDKAKKNKGKGKVKLKVDDANPLSAYVNDYDDFNDFM